MGMADLQWVPHADALCQRNGCRLPEALSMMAAAKQVGEVAQRMDVDDVALWCGIGGHAFSGRDPGRQRVTAEQWDEDAQRMAPVSVSACGEHARPMLTVTRPPKAPPAIEPVSVTDPAEARRRGYDPAYVKWLEAQNGMTPSE